MRHIRKVILAFERQFRWAKNSIKQNEFVTAEHVMEKLRRFEAEEWKQRERRLLLAAFAFCTDGRRRAVTLPTIGKKLRGAITFYYSCYWLWWMRARITFARTHSAGGGGWRLLLFASGSAADHATDATPLRVRRKSSNCLFGLAEVMRLIMNDKNE